MDVANELLDAIEIIVDKKIRENTAQIYPGICKSVSGNSCVMSINGKDNTIQFYGSIPTVGAIYRVFVPDGNMSMAFAITGNDDRKGLQYSNPNLLDNWYFGNPVNQRGQTSYTGVGYGIDRFLKESGGTIIIENDGITVDASNGATNFIQKGDINKINSLLGKTVTLSALFSDNTLLTATGTFQDTIPTSTDVVVCQVNSSGIILSTQLFGMAKSYQLFRFTLDSGNTKKLKAAKLELGSQQTLAHQDADGNWVLNEIPDYGEQLARCQRYFQLYSSADLRPAKAVDCRPTMHTDPSQGTIIIDGTTYYYNTADL